MESEQGRKVDGNNDEHEQKPLKLKLHSPAGGEALVFLWGKTEKERRNSGLEILDIVRFAALHFTELQALVSNHFNLEQIDYTSYEQMKSLCKKFNKAANAMSSLWKGATKPGSNPNSEYASADLLRQIVTRSYNRAVDDEKALNKHYEAFSSQTYGETSYERMQMIMDEIELKDKDIFADLGSGVGQLVVHVAGGSRVKKALGIEIAQLPCRFASLLEVEFRKWMKWFGKKYRPFQLCAGNFLDSKYREQIMEATVIFINNYAYQADLESRIKRELLCEMKDGTKIISTKPYAPLNRDVTERQLNDVAAIMDVYEMKECPNPSVSWTSNHVPYYLHIINRGKLERYFFNLRNPSLRTEGSRRSSAQSSKNASRESSVGIRERENSMRFRNHPANGEDLVCGPTTRRKWNDYVSELEQQKRRKGAHDEDEDDLASTSKANHESMMSDEGNGDPRSPSEFSLTSPSGRKPPTKKPRKEKERKPNAPRGRPRKTPKVGPNDAHNHTGHNNPRLSAEAKEGMELMHQITCAVSHGKVVDDPTKMLSEMHASTSRMAAIASVEETFSRAAVKIPFPTTPSHIRQNGRSKYANLDAFLDDLRILYENFLDSVRIQESELAKKKSPHKAENMATIVKREAMEDRAEVNGDLPNPRINTFIETSQRIISRHQKIHAKLSDIAQEIDAVQRETAQLLENCKDFAANLKQEQHEKERTQHQNSLLTLCTNAANVPSHPQQPSASLFQSSTAALEQLVLSDLANQYQPSSAASSLARLISQLNGFNPPDLSSLQALAASLGINPMPTVPLASPVAPQPPQVAPQQQQPPPLSSYLSGLDLSAFTGPAFNNSALAALASAMPNSNCANVLNAPQSSHLASAAAAASLSPVGPPPQQPLVPPSDQHHFVAPTTSTVSTFTTVASQQPSFTETNGSMTPNAKKNRSRTSRSSGGSKKNGTTGKESDDPLKQQEIERQVQSIVAKALLVDSAAKCAEKERKARSTDKRKDKTVLTLSPITSTSSALVTQESAMSLPSPTTKKRTSSDAGLPQAPDPSPLLPPSISLPSAFTTAASLTSPITPTSATHFSSAPTSGGMTFMPSSVSLAISAATFDASSRSTEGDKENGIASVPLTSSLPATSNTPSAETTSLVNGVADKSRPPAFPGQAI
jgi:hypothetical protein